MHSSSWIGYRSQPSRTMVAECKGKRLGHPSRKLSGNVPRATWRAIFFRRLSGPFVMAVNFTIAYIFVKSFPDRDGNQLQPRLLSVLRWFQVDQSFGTRCACCTVNRLIDFRTYLTPHFPGLVLDSVAPFTHALGLPRTARSFQLLVCNSAPLFQ